MDGQIRPMAEAVAGTEAVVVHRITRPAGSFALPEAILNFVMRTHEPLILTDAQAPNLYSADLYIRDRRARSILCMPLLKQTRLIGMLYLENDLLSNVFTPARLSLLHILASQASISIENAQLFDAVQVAREHARQSANELRQAFDMIPALAWSSTPDGSLEFANKRWHDFTGIPREELTSDIWLSTYHPEDAIKVIQKWSELLTLGISGEVEARMRRYDGAVRSFLVQATPVRDSEGRIVRWYGTNVDIDDIRRIAEAQERLDRAARVTAMGELTVSIAHEVNQPLMAIVTNAATCVQWLSDDNLNLERARQAAERIVRDGHRAGDVIASIRALAKKSQSEMGDVDLNKVILEMLTLMRGELQRKGIVAETDLVTDACIVGDRTQMQQVFLNLIMNAIEAIAAGERESKRIRICTKLSDPGNILVSVADTGVGLSTDACEQIFEAFYTTKPDGIGMGLSICRSIIQAHGGRLWATPNLPDGSIFYFSLAICNDDSLSTRTG
jgi:PAS domain S-box-containing protein